MEKLQIIIFCYAYAVVAETVDFTQEKTSMFFLISSISLNLNNSVI